MATSAAPQSAMEQLNANGSGASPAQSQDPTADAPQELTGEQAAAKTRWREGSREGCFCSLSIQLLHLSEFFASVFGAANKAACPVGESPTAGIGSVPA